MDAIKEEEGYTLTSDPYQEMLQADVDRLSADGYTVNVTRDQAGNIAAYTATQEGVPTISFEDNEYLQEMIKTSMAEQAQAEEEQEVGAAFEL